MTTAATTPPDGPIVRARTSVELDADTTLLEGVFPAGSGYIRIGDRSAYVDLIAADLPAARRLLAATTAMVQRLATQQGPAPVSLAEAHRREQTRATQTAGLAEQTRTALRLVGDVDDTDTGTAEPAGGGA